MRGVPCQASPPYFRPGQDQDPEGEGSQLRY